MYLTKRMKTFKVCSNKHLVCNAISGEIIVLTDAGLKLLDSLHNGDSVSCDHSTLELLQEKGFLYSSEQEESAAFLNICQSSRDNYRLNAPRHYTFIVNSHCNFNCPYCFEQESFRIEENTLSREQVDAAFRIIDEDRANNAHQRTPDFEIFGGEPLQPCSKDILDYIMSKLAQRNYTASVQTNGYFLSSFVDFFENYQTNIRQIQLTLDGPKSIHDRRRCLRGGAGTFDRIVSGIDAVVQKNLSIHIHLRINVDRDNLDYLKDMIEFYTEKGWTENELFTFNAAPVDNRCGTIKNPAKLISWLEMFDHAFPLSTDAGTGPYDLSVFKILSYFRHYLSTVRQPSQEKPQFLPKVLYCEAAAMKLFAFHPDGNIYPCPETVGMQEMAIGTYHPNFTLDSVKTQRWQDQSILKREQCPDCGISTFCGGGCILTALIQNGTMSKPDCENAPEILQSYFGRLSDES